MLFFCVFSVLCICIFPKPINGKSHFFTICFYHTDSMCYVPPRSSLLNQNTYVLCSIKTPMLNGICQHRTFARVHRRSGNRDILKDSGGGSCQPSWTQLDPPPPWGQASRVGPTGAYLFLAGSQKNRQKSPSPPVFWESFSPDLEVKNQKVLKMGHFWPF